MTALRSQTMQERVYRYQMAAAGLCVAYGRTTAIHVPQFAKMVLSTVLHTKPVARNSSRLAGRVDVLGGEPECARRIGYRGRVVAPTFRRLTPTEADNP